MVFYTQPTSLRKRIKFLSIAAPCSAFTGGLIRESAANMIILADSCPAEASMYMSEHQSPTHPAFYRTVLEVKRRAADFVTDVHLVSNAWSYNSTPSYSLKA